jgi:hypothetical protein
MRATGTPAMTYWRERLAASMWNPRKGWRRPISLQHFRSRRRQMAQALRHQQKCPQAGARGHLFVS